MAHTKGLYLQRCQSGIFAARLREYQTDILNSQSVTLDRMEVCSPGGKIGVPLPDDIIKNRVRSERRNPIIADVFNRMSLMERRGSGLREICTATASEDAYRPEFMPRLETGENWFTVTLYNMNYVEADTVGTQVGTPSCNTMPDISTSFFDALAC